MKTAVGLALMAASTGVLAASSMRWGANNLTAFKTVIRAGESGGDYRALVGGGRFESYAAHPAELGWRGIVRDDGRRSTAAGAYQITLTTWGDVRRPTFSPQDQDSAADALLARRGALGVIDQGNIPLAVELLRDEWEMFVTKAWPIDRVVREYIAAGGKLSKEFDL